MTDLSMVITTRSILVASVGPIVPGLFADAGERASLRFMEFFTANIRNKNTRQAYFAYAQHTCENRTF